MNANTSAKRTYYRRLLPVFTVLLPLLTASLLYLCTRWEGNVMYRTEAAVLSFICRLLTDLCFMTGLAFLAAVRLTPVLARPVLPAAANVLSAVILYLTPFVTAALLLVRFDTVWDDYLLIFAVDLGVICLAIAVAALFLFRKKARFSPGSAGRRHAARIVFLTALGLFLFRCVCGTISDLWFAAVAYGDALPKNAAEWRYLAAPYLRAAPSLAAGYAAVRGLLALFAAPSDADGGSDEKTLAI